MPQTLTEKIIASHIVSGKPSPGEAIAIKIDQTLTQDATGTMAYLQFETLGLERTAAELSVSYIDHNTMQEDHKNMDDHRYLQSVADRYGLWLSRAGNGICHQVHLERFGLPGKTLLGSDSHTPTGGGLGMLAIGAGGLDVAAAMGGGAFHLVCPRVIGVRLQGRLRPPVSAKDIILELLRRETVKGGVGAVYEYFGAGAASLSVPERATITNMGAELGATSSVFPSDETTRQFLEDRGRGALWAPLAADPGAQYERVIEIDLDSLAPMAARPHSPDNVVPVADLAGLPVDQVILGSCTNSSLDDLARAAAIVRGKTVHPRVSAGLAPGSRTTLLAAARGGILEDLIRAGFRILECACGPCIGMGFAPKSGGVSLRTFNRNFKGRSGTADAALYLVSPETAAAAAIAGEVAVSGSPGPVPDTRPLLREALAIAGDGLLVPPLPPEEAARVEIERGPNIKPCPLPEPLPDELRLPVILKTRDNITTDDIIPAGAKVLPFRSNIPEIAKFTFSAIDGDFYRRAQEAGQSLIAGGENYGQGSSREHAALAPMYLGVRAVIAKSFARIHKANLINYGIIPLTFENGGDLEKISEGDTIVLPGLREFLAGSGDRLAAQNITKNAPISLLLDADRRAREILAAGGLIRYTKNGGK